MSDPGPRERAETAFGHMQHAARELIAAAHDTLDLLEQVVTTAGLGEILASFNHLGHSLLNRPSPPPPEASPTSERTGDRATRPHGPVERISVR